MKMVLYIVVLIGLAGAYAWWSSRSVEQERKEMSLQYQRMVESDEKRRVQAEKAEKAEAEAKDGAVKMLNSYLNREKQRLNRIVEECKIAMERIDLDQKDLSDAIVAVEKENERQAEISRRRNEPRFDKAERVSLILKNPAIKAMAEKYLGEDLAATYAKYKSEVRTELELHRKSEARLRQNRDRYYKSVKGLNEKVEQANVRARKQNDAIIREAEFNLKILKKDREPLVREAKMLMKQVANLASPMLEKRLKELEERIAPFDEKIAAAQLQLDTIKAQAAHMDATETETMARKGYDTAQAARAEADNDVHKDRAHEIAMYQTAARYEGQTLDRIRDMMKITYREYSFKAADAKKKLDYISRSVANIDFLKADEIEAIRKNVVEELSKGLAADGTDRKE